MISLSIIIIILIIGLYIFSFIEDWHVRNLEHKENMVKINTRIKEHIDCLKINRKEAIEIANANYDRVEKLLQKEVERDAQVQAIWENEIKADISQDNRSYDQKFKDAGYKEEIINNTKVFTKEPIDLKEPASCETCDFFDKGKCLFGVMAAKPGHYCLEWMKS